MDDVRRYHHGDLRRHLVIAARAEVEEHGVENVVLTRVAQACGVSVAAPYRHFASKEALLAEVAIGGFGELTEALRVATPEGSSPRDRLLDAGVAYLRFAVANPQIFRLMFNAEVRGSVDDASQESLGVLIDLVRECDLAVPVDAAVRASWAMVHGYATLGVGGMDDFLGVADERVRADFEGLLDGLLAA